MRVRLSGAVVFAVAFFACARPVLGAARNEDTSNGTDATRALSEANADLAAKPAKSDDARRALDRAIAASDSGIVAEAYFRLGALDEEDGAFSRALTDYEACIGAKSSSRWARNARKRIAWLGARSEGDFVPLALLQRMKRDPALANDTTAIGDFARKADAFPPGIVRGDARMLVAEIWLSHPSRLGEAMQELRKVLDDPNADRRTAVFAERDLVGARLSRGELDGAVTEVHRYPFDPQIAAEVRELVRRRTLRRALTGAIVGLAGLVIVGVVHLWRRRRVSTPGTGPTTNNLTSSTDGKLGDAR